MSLGMFGVPGPLATPAVNVAGSAMMGILARLVAAGIAIPEAWHGFVAVGFLGAFKTFSSFALDIGTLMARQGLWMGIVYVGLSVLLSLVAFLPVQGLVACSLARAT